MIFDAIIFLGAGLINSLAYAFSLLNMTIPDQFTNALTYFLNSFSVLGGIINLLDIYQALGWFVVFISYWYGIKLILKIASFIPFFGNTSPKVL